MWKLSIIFIITTWYLFYNPDLLIKYTPILISRFFSNEPFEEILLNKLTLTDAFHIGQISKYFETINTSTSDKETYLNMISSIVNKNITWEQFNILIYKLNQNDNNINYSFLYKIGITFVIIYCIYCAVIYYILYDLTILESNKYYIIFINFVKKYIFSIKEQLIYIISFLFIVDGLRVNNIIGIYISLIGCVGYIYGLMYSIYLHSDNSNNELVNKNTQIINFMNILIFIPITLLHNSIFLGFITIVILYSLIGFRIICFNVCLKIGFETTESLKRAVLISFYLILITIITKSNYIYLFSVGIQVYGCSIYFLGLLIMSKHYSFCNDKNRNQKILIISLLVAFYISTIYNIVSIFYNSIIFTILFTIEHLFNFIKKYNIVIFGFNSNICSYFCTTYNHTYPEFVISLIPEYN